ncbi:MAG: hypothetical protein A2X56_02485 [Nitrospirae bacterium GWC2_57_13]|nr:MAG: hypothetical protein A2072_07700 [Nitrospirae bacterium GWC1_57_7]OGW27618.1 MAG: hypothetical protein A2X56_02485 [Nitrospirae bacterium GWC2_57_13]OGW45265.1 MAG: hypothetical protein A2X57_09290 [Nitrospirae bacterium GWD2_57_8]HAS53464.1 hypothetical protein [Nitrospiraceae bacterium]
MAPSFYTALIAYRPKGTPQSFFLIIGGFFEDLLPLVAADDNVIEGSMELYSRLSKHDGKVAEN